MSREFVEDSGEEPWVYQSICLEVPVSMKTGKNLVMGFLAGFLLLTACQSVQKSEVHSAEAPPELFAGVWSTLMPRQPLPEDLLTAARFERTNPRRLSYAYSGQLNSSHFDRNWFQEDQAHFRELMEMPDTPGKATKILMEISQLRLHQQQVIHRVHGKHPYYRIFDPSETDEINSLFIALRARQNWLKDHIYNVPSTDWREYYPQDYEYAFFQMQHLNIQGGIETAKVDVTEDFAAYDEKALVAFLDTLPVPPKVFRGKEIFFINGGHADYGAVHANGQIMVFNLFDTKEEILKLIAHEIGHEAGYLIFGRDGYENENESRKKNYADLYDQQVPNDDRVIWGMRLSENFAEDFAWVYGDFPKWSYWQGAEQETVRTFIENHLAAADLGDAILIRDNLQISSGNDTMTFFGGIHENNLVIVTEPELRIRIDGFYLGPYSLHAHVRNNVTGNLPRVAFHESGQVTLPLLTRVEEERRLEEEGYVYYEVQIKMYHYTSLQKYHQPTIARFHVLLWEGW